MNLCVTTKTIYMPCRTVDPTSRHTQVLCMPTRYTDLLSSSLTLHAGWQCLKSKMMQQDDRPLPAWDSKLTTCNRQDDAGGPRCVAHIARAGPFGDTPYGNWPANAHREGLLVVACQHVLCQVLAEAVVGVVEAQALHDGLHLQHT